EIAMQCTQIAGEIRRADAEAFLAGKKDYASPAWKPFKELVGDSPASRKLFAEIMSRDDRAVEIEKAELDPAKAHEVYATVMGRAKEALDQTMKRFMGQPISDEMGWAAQKALKDALPAIDVAAVLFLGRREIPAGVIDISPPSWFFSTGFAEGI